MRFIHKLAQRPYSQVLVKTFSQLFVDLLASGEELLSRDGNFIGLGRCSAFRCNVCAGRDGLVDFSPRTA